MSPQWAKRPWTMGMDMRNILVATDGSEGAERAVAFAAELAHALSAKLVILAVSEPSISRDLEEFRRAEGSTIGDIVEADAAAHVKHAIELANNQGAMDIQEVTRAGDPAHVILAVARDLAADLVVVGKRGFGRVKGFALGSVSQNLAAHADRIVVIVP